MVGMLAKVSTLLMRVGAFHKPALRRIRRPRNSVAALAFDRGQQRGFFAANISARADAQVDAEIEAAVENRGRREGPSRRACSRAVRSRAIARGDSPRA